MARLAALLRELKRRLLGRPKRGDLSVLDHLPIKGGDSNRLPDKLAEAREKMNKDSWR